MKAPFHRNDPLKRACPARGWTGLEHHGKNTMPNLQTVRGRIVALRRLVNVHLKELRPLVPSERHELWVRPKGGVERKFIIHTRTMPARCGHEVSLIFTGNETPKVLGLANWTVLDGANYVRTDPQWLLRPRDALALSALCVVLLVVLGEASFDLFVLVWATYLAGAVILRALARSRLAEQVDRAIELEAERGKWCPRHSYSIRAGGEMR